MSCSNDVTTENTAAAKTHSFEITGKLFKEYQESLCKEIRIRYLVKIVVLKLQKKQHRRIDREKKGRKKRHG